MIGQIGLPFRKRKCTFACFEPAEVGRVAGLKPEVEKAWDRSGKMPWGQRERQTVSAVPVVKLALHHELSSRGWEFEDSNMIVGKCIANVFFYALLAADGACKVTGMPDPVDRFRADFIKDAELAASLTCERDRHRYMYRYGDDGQFEYGNDLQRIIDRSGPSSLRLIDLQGVAVRLCNRAQAPLLNIELAPEAPYTSDLVEWLSTSRI